MKKKKPTRPFNLGIVAGALGASSAFSQGFSQRKTVLNPLSQPLQISTGGSFFSNPPYSSPPFSKPRKEKPKKKCPFCDDPNCKFDPDYKEEKNF